MPLEQATGAPRFDLPMRRSPNFAAAPRRHRVVIVGAGFGGLFAARALPRAPPGVTVIDRTNPHLFEPLLYQVAHGPPSVGAVTPPTRGGLLPPKNNRG